MVNNSHDPKFSIFTPDYFPVLIKVGGLNRELLLDYSEKDRFVLHDNGIKTELTFRNLCVYFIKIGNINKIYYTSLGRVDKFDRPVSMDINRLRGYIRNNTENKIIFYSLQQRCIFTALGEEFCYRDGERVNLNSLSRKDSFVVHPCNRIKSFELERQKIVLEKTSSKSLILYGLAGAFFACVCRFIKE